VWGGLFSRAEMVYVEVVPAAGGAVEQASPEGFAA